MIILTGQGDYEVDLEATRARRHRLPRQGPARHRAARALDPLRHPPPRDARRAAQEPGALRARGARAPTTGSGTGTSARRPDLPLAPLEVHARVHRRRPSATRRRSGWAACTPTTSSQLRAAIDAHLDGRSRPPRDRAPHAPPRRRLPLGAQPRRRRSATRDGKATRMAGSMSDITDRKAAEERLRPRRASRRAHGPAQPRAVPRPARRARSPAPSASPTTAAPSSSSTSTASSSSTTASATRSGDQLLVALARRLDERPAARATPSPGSAATSSRSCSDGIGSARRGRARSPTRIQRRAAASRSRSTGASWSSPPASASRSASAASRAGRAPAQRRHRDVRTPSARARAASAVFDEQHAQPRGQRSSSWRPSCAARSRSERLRVFYQPIVDLRHRRDSAASRRWRAGPTAGPQVTPDEFIPVAEDTGLIGPLGPPGPERGVRATSSTGARAGLVADDVTVSVNVSGRQFGEREPGRGRGRRARVEPTCSPDALRLEITESTRDVRARAHARDARRAGAPRRSRADRRLRHRLLVAHLPPALPGRRAQDRSLLHRVDAPRRGQRRDRPGGHRARRTASASR